MNLRNTRDDNEFPAVGVGFQAELKEILALIWENQQFLDHKDLEELRKFGK